MVFTLSTGISGWAFCSPGVGAFGRSVTFLGVVTGVSGSLVVGVVGTSGVVGVPGITAGLPGTISPVGVVGLVGVLG
ncbi:hypothetical protein KOM07_02515 [Lentilactobacillus sp. G22-6]|nr:hypothetical protein [Lentilactobacillus dabitei]